MNTKPKAKPNGWEEELNGQSMAIVDGFMTVLGWDRYMTVKERQGVNDNLDSYVKSVLSQAILSAEKETVKRCIEACGLNWKPTCGYESEEEKGYQKGIMAEQLQVKTKLEELLSLSLPDQEQLLNSKTE